MESFTGVPSFSQLISGGGSPVAVHCISLGVPGASLTTSGYWTIWTFAVNSFGIKLAQKIPMYAVPMLLRVILGLRTDSDLWHTFYRYSCRRRCYETQYVFCSACVNGFMLLLNPPKNEGTIFVNTIAWPNFWHIPNSSRCPRYFRFWSAFTFA